jgi:VanZ family protein
VNQAETTFDARWRHWYQRALPIYWLFLLLTTHLPRLTLDTGIPNDDKLAHFCAFGLLAFLFWRCRQTLSRPIGPRFAPAAAAWIALYAAIDEYTQPWVGRSGDVRDWVADMSGAAAVVLLLELHRRGVFRAGRLGRTLATAAKWLRGPSLASITGDDEEPAYRPIDLALLKRMLRWLAPFKKRYALGIGLGIVMVVLEMQSPLFISRIVNYAMAYLGGDLQPPATGREAALHVAAIVLIWAVVLACGLLLERKTIRS